MSSADQVRDKQLLFISLPQGELVRFDEKGNWVGQEKLEKAVVQGLKQVPLPLRSIHESSRQDRFDDNGTPFTETFFSVNPRACSVEMFGLSQIMLVRGFPVTMVGNVQALGNLCLQNSGFSTEKYHDLEKKLATVKEASDIVKSTQCAVAGFDANECDISETLIDNFDPLRSSPFNRQMPEALLKKNTPNDEYVAEILFESAAFLASKQDVETEQAVARLRSGFFRKAYTHSCGVIASSGELAIGLGDETAGRFFRKQLENLETKALQEFGTDSVLDEALVDKIRLAQAGLSLSAAEYFFNTAHQEAEAFSFDGADTSWRQGFQEYVKASEIQHPELVARMAGIFRRMDAEQSFIAQKRAESQPVVAQKSPVRVPPVMSTIF